LLRFDKSAGKSLLKVLLDAAHKKMPTATDAYGLLQEST